MPQVGQIQLLKEIFVHERQQEYFWYLIVDSREPEFNNFYGFSLIANHLYPGFDGLSSTAYQRVTLEDC